MKSINRIIKETVNPPKSEDEKRFVAKHVIAKKDHPVAPEDQFVTKTKKDKTKDASYHDGEDKEVYEETVHDDLDEANQETYRVDHPLHGRKTVKAHNETHAIKRFLTGKIQKNMHNEFINGVKRKQFTVKKMNEEVQDLEEKAVSKAQATAARIALAAKKGDLPKSKLKGASKDMHDTMSKKELKDYSKVDDDAPERVEETTILESLRDNVMKLKDGSTIKVQQKDADALDQLFKNLNKANKQKMKDSMMKDKKGFDMVLKFAKEAV